MGEGGSPGIKKPGPQSWLSAFACCLTFAQAPTLPESPFAHLQNGSDGHRRYLRVSGRPLVQVNCSMTLVPYPMVSETPPNLQATHSRGPSLSWTDSSSCCSRGPSTSPPLTLTPTSRMSATTAQLQDRNSSPSARNTCGQRVARVRLPALSHLPLPTLSLPSCGERDSGFTDLLGWARSGTVSRSGSFKDG